MNARTPTHAAALALSLIACDALSAPTRGEPRVTREELVAFRDGEIRSLAAGIAAPLDAFGRRYEALAAASPSAQERDEKSGELRLYLLLTGPREAGEVPAGDAAQAIVDALAERDERPLGEPARARRAARARAWLADPANLLPRDGSLVGRARAALSRAVTIDELLERCEARSLALEDLVGRSSPLRSDRSVRGAFTRGCWEAEVAPSLFSAEEPWLLGPASPHAANRRASLDAYLRAYVVEWRELVTALRFPPGEVEATLEGVGRAAVVVGSAIRGDPPCVELLLSQIAYQTVLAVPAHAETEEPPPAQGEDEPLAPADVYAAFEGLTAPIRASGTAPSDIDVYDSHLRRAHVILLRWEAAGVGGLRPADRSALEDVRAEIRSLIERQELGWRPALMRLLWPPVQATDGALGM